MEHHLEYKDENVQESNEYLSKIYWGKHMAITADVFMEGQPEDKTFFKVYRLGEEADFDTIKGVCRISLDKPEYIEGYDSDIKLTNEEIDEIMEAFSCDNNARWKYLLGTTNISLEGKDNINKRFDIDNYQIPNYNLLKEVDL